MPANDVMLNEVKYPLVAGDSSFAHGGLRMTGSSWLTDSAAFLQSISSEFVDAQEEVKPFFKQHELQPHHQRAISFDQPVQDWLFLVIIALLVVVAYVRTIFTKYLNQIVSGFFSGHITNQLYRDENLLIQRTLLLLSIN